MPITPQEACERKLKSIPEEVYEAFDECIVAHLTLGGRSSFTFDEVIDRIVYKYDIKGVAVARNDIYNHNWLDVEPVYRHIGWKVTCEGSGFIFHTNKG